MSGNGDELTAQIKSLAESIKTAKAEKKPKEEWDPLLKEMLALKISFKEVTGKDFDPPKQEKKKKGNDQQASSTKNAEKNAAKAAKKAEKEAKKLANRLERERREKEKAAKLAGLGQDNFGDSKMVQSHPIKAGEEKTWTKIKDLTPEKKGQEVLVRGYLHTSRGVGKGVFIVLRSTLYSVQAVCFESEEISKAMVKYIEGLPVESVVDVKGSITVPETPIQSATQKLVELQITSFYCVSKASSVMPFQMEDACRPDCGKETDVGAYTGEEEEKPSADGLARVGQEARLNYRWIDLRTPANQAIFRIESMVGCLFREFLMKNDFVEIHTPKIIGGASEGGSEVFKLDYFGQPACLAMSPQLHKQMTSACSGFERVFETGPVFRAENSQTRRHLCEFTGFDLEMVINEHYNECLDIFDKLFVFIFDGLNERCKNELERVREQHPFEDLVYKKKTLTITYAEGCKLLREAGIEQDDLEDIGTEKEKQLGDIVKEKYGVDFFFMDKYPLAVRPFYTMPDPENPKLSNSYDFFIRGQEILSGAQRIHDPDLLEERAKAWEIPLEDIAAYVNSFRNGALPHAGGGIGLERVVMLFLGLPNIRKSAWFPRDPKRIAP